MDSLFTKLDGSQIKYIQKEINPKLDIALTTLINKLLEIKEPEKYIEYKRIKYYQNLYITLEDIKNKGKEDQGSDYNEDSDDEYRQADMLMEQFEQMNQNNIATLEQAKDESLVQEQIDKLKEQRDMKKNPEKYKQKQIVKKESFSSSKEEDEDQEDIDNQSEHQQDPNLPIFNPLQFLAKELKIYKQQRLAQEAEKIRYQNLQRQSTRQSYQITFSLPQQQQQNKKIDQDDSSSCSSSSYQQSENNGDNNQQQMRQIKFTKI